MSARFEEVTQSLRTRIVVTILAAGLILIVAILWREDALFVTLALPITACLLTIAAFNVYRVTILLEVIKKLDQLLQLLEKTKYDRSPDECQNPHNELAEIRAALLRKRPLERFANRN